MSEATCETHGHIFGVGARCVMCGANAGSGGSPRMTEKKIPKGCVCNLLSNATCARGSFRCDRRHKVTTADQDTATVIRGLRAELDAARARERHALVAGAEALRRIAAATPIGHEDVTKGPSTYNWLCYAASLLMDEAATMPATPLEQELITMRAREAKLREALTQIAHGGPLEGQRVASPMKMYQAQAVARAALAALEDTPPVCDCNGGEQGDGLCALPHEPTCASLKREDTRG